MSAPSAAKRARPAALEATVITLAVPGLSEANGIFMLAEGTCLFSSLMKTILQLAPSGRLATIAGNKAKLVSSRTVKASQLASRTHLA